MKKIVISLLCILSISYLHAQNSVGIGTTLPDPYSVLDLRSTTQGLLAPRLTSTDMSTLATNIANTSEGMLVYSLTDGIFYVWDGVNTWNPVGGSDTDWIKDDVNNYVYNVTDRVGIGTSSPATMLEIETTSTANSLFRVRAGSVHIEMSRNTILQRGASSDFNIQSMENDIVFGNGNPITEKMRIEMGGNIGIGTPSPGNKLHVFGGSITIDDGVNPYTLPLSDGATGDVLTTDGLGNITWQAASSGNDWSLSGNSITAGNILGTTNAQDLIIVAGNNTAITIDDVTQNTGIGINPSTTAQLSVRGSAPDDNISINVDNTYNGSGATYSINNLVNNTATGRKTGIANTVYSGSTTFSVYGVNNSMNGSSSASITGTQNLMNGNGSGTNYGTYNAVINTGNGTHYGVYNTIDNTGNGTHYGVYNQITQGNAAASNYLYGTDNRVDNNGSGRSFGSRNGLYGTGAGEKYGTFNALANGSGWKFGVYNDVDQPSGSNAPIYGAYNLVDHNGSGSGFGIQNRIGGTSNSSQYGVYTQFQNYTGGGNAYAVYNDFTSFTGAGISYGFYSNGEDMNYFSGDIDFDGSLMPLGNAGAAGQVLTSQGPGASPVWQAAGVADNDWTVNGTDMYSAVSGNVGIGTATPQSKLHIATSSYALTRTAGTLLDIYSEVVDSRTYIRFSQDIPFSLNPVYMGVDYDFGNVEIWAEDNLPILFGNSNTERMRVHSNGNVGIGTNNPATKLSVNGLARIENLGAWPTTGEGLEIAYDPTLNRGYIQVYDRVASTWGDLYLGDGNVGIGTTVPSTSLEINNNTSSGNTNGSLELVTNINNQTNNLIAVGNSTGTPGSGTEYSRAHLSGYGANPSGTNNYGVWGHQFGNGSGGFGVIASNGASTTAPNRWVGLGGNTNVIRIVDGSQANGRVLTSDANGNGTWQDNTVAGMANMAVGFMVKTNSTSNSQTFTSSASRVNWTINSFNDGGHFNLTNDYYVAPVAGVYSFQAAAVINGQSNGNWLIMELRVNGVTQAQSFSNPNSWGSAGTSVNATLKLNANDQVSVYIRNSNGSGIVGSIDDYNFFSGHRVY